MGLPVFRFTLSNGVELPSLSKWRTRSGESPSWNINSTPSISFSGVDASIIETDAILIPGVYQFNYQFVISGSGTTNIVLIGYNGASIVSDPSTGFFSLSGSGTFSGSISLKINSQSNVFAISVTNFNANPKTVTINSFQLLSGSNTHEISEPDGWEKAKLKMERHPDFHSLVEYFEGAFIFYGNNGIDDGGIEYIKSMDQAYGFDAKINILVEATFDSVSYETIFEGQLDLSALEELKDNKMSVPIIRNDFWAKFIARKGTPVNLRSTTDLDDNATSNIIGLVDINLPSQKVPKIHYSYELEGSAATPIDNDNPFVQFTPSFFELDELDNFYNLPTVPNPEKPVWSFDVVEAGEYLIEIFWSISSLSGSTENHPNGLHIYVQINDNTAIQLSEVDQTGGAGFQWTEYSYSTSHNLKEGDTVTIYGTWGAVPPDFRTAGFWGKNGLRPTNYTFYSHNRPSGMAAIPTYTRVTAQTTFPDTSGQAYLIHDAANSITDRIIGRSNTFYSEHFGSIVTNGRTYSEDGCAWKNILINGLQLKGYTFDEKQMSMSFDKWWKGANPLFNLSLQYDTINGEEVIRVEPKVYAYDFTSISVNISNVREISREYDNERIFNVLSLGFSRWESEDISGLDDPQTKRTYATKVQKINNELQMYSDFIAAGIAIEVTRRQSKEKTKDYKYDNETFIIAINGDDISPDRYKPELNENFNSIIGLKNSDTRYNSIHTPMRMLLRWANYWNGCLQKYQTTSIKFVSGEGNYDMVSDFNCSIGGECLSILCDAISEKQDIPLGPPANYGTVFDYIHLPILYKIEVIDFSWDDYLSIRNNRRKAIGISQGTSGFKKVFIKELNYELCNSKATIQAWAFDELILGVQDSEQPGDPCIPQPFVFDEDYQAILDYSDSQGYSSPSFSQKLLQNSFLIQLKAIGVWNQLDLLYVFATNGDRNFAKINWISPGTFQATEVNTVTFTQNIGFNGNATNSYLNTTWIPSTNGVNFTQNDGGTICFVNNALTDPPGTVKYAYGVIGNSGSSANGRVTLIPREPTTVTHQFAVNSGNNSKGSSVSSNGFYQTRIVTGNDLRIFKNSSQIGTTASVTSTTLSNKALAIGALNNNGSITNQSNYQIGIFGTGASLNGKESDLYTAWNNYFTSL